MANLKDIRNQKRLLNAAKKVTDNPNPDFLVLAGPNKDGKFALSTNMSKDLAIALIIGAFDGTTNNQF